MKSRTELWLGVIPHVKRSCSPTEPPVRRHLLAAACAVRTPLLHGFQPGSPLSFVHWDGARYELFSLILSSHRCPVLGAPTFFIVCSGFIASAGIVLPLLEWALQGGVCRSPKVPGPMRPLHKWAPGPCVELRLCSAALAYCFSPEPLLHYQTTPRT